MHYLYLYYMFISDTVQTQGSELVTQRQVRLLNQGSSSSGVHIEDAC